MLKIFSIIFVFTVALYSQDLRHQYTVAIAYVEKEASLNNIISNYLIEKEKKVYVLKYKKGFHLTYGLFDNRADANIFKSQLSPKIKSLKPYILEVEPDSLDEYAFGDKKIEKKDIVESQLTENISDENVVLEKVEPKQGAMTKKKKISTLTDFFMQVNYGYHGGEVNSSENNEGDNTKFASLLIGKKYTNVRTYLSYDHIKWDDALARSIIFNMDYIIPRNNYEYYIGAGIGVMNFEADYIDDTNNGFVGSARAGINYAITHGMYIGGGLRGLFTNDITIRDSATKYADIDNLLGLEIGLGYKF